MSDNNQTDGNSDVDDFSESDEAVSAFYRANSTESPPGRLDDIILRQAAAAARPKRASDSFFSFLRPITFVATLTISLAIVLQFNDTWILGAPDSDAAEDAAGAIAEALEGSARRLQEQSHSASDLLNLGSPNPSAKTGNDGSIDALPSTHSAATHYCDSTVAETADGWWRCILQLERNGRTADAAIEQERFNSAYPDFRPPQ